MLVTVSQYHKWFCMIMSFILTEYPRILHMQWPLVHQIILYFTHPILK